VTPEQIGILGCVALVVLLCSSIPVAIAMAVVGFVGFAAVVNPHAAVSVLTFDLYKTFASYSLTVIPLFVLMGQVAFHGGISRRLFDAAYHWLGPLPGGLAMATVGACTAFGAICGSGPATTATMAAVALPEMRRYKYSMELACGTVASGGTIGMMIPPSVVFLALGIAADPQPHRSLRDVIPQNLSDLDQTLLDFASFGCGDRPPRADPASHLFGGRPPRALGARATPLALLAAGLGQGFVEHRIPSYPTDPMEATRILTPERTRPGGVKPIGVQPKGPFGPPVGQQLEHRLGQIEQRVASFARPPHQDRPPHGG
jgi:hypothetical protein